MKIVISAVFLILITIFATAQAQETKQGVTVLLRDGSNVHGKLDAIDKDSVVIFVVGSDKKLQSKNIARSDVLALSFDDKDYGKEFQAGDQGVVLADGTVLKGHLNSMTADSFVLHRPATDKMQSIDRTKVVFIQFEKPAAADTDKEPGPKTGKVTRVVVSATQPWTDTGIDIQQGEMVRFEADEQEVITCDPRYPNNNAHGVKTFWVDPTRPVPDASACSLLGKIGFSSKPFDVALHLQLQSAKESGRLFLGINDTDFRNNRGQFTVSVEVIKQ
jgi:hypothetical protein